MNNLDRLFSEAIPFIAASITVTLVFGSFSSCMAEKEKQTTIQVQARAKALTDLVQAGANPVLANCVIERDTTSVLCVQHQAWAPMKAAEK